MGLCLSSPSDSPSPSSTGMVTSVQVGTVGGGTQLASQAACLKGGGGEEWGSEKETTKKSNKASGEAKKGTRVRKQMPRGLEEKYEAYFLPRKPWPKAMAFYGSFILGGIGAGMLLEAWIDKKVKDDGGVIWEFDR